jgi:predicted dehydrogenase
MARVKIFGAGSIGNHLAHGCRSKNWDVTICDTDPAALERTRDSIYAERYGAWDEAIRLASVDAAETEAFDIVIIGTPPDSHIPLALEVLARMPPPVLLIEKPLCPPSLAGCLELKEAAAATGTQVVVGYNHTLTDHTRRAAEVIGDASLASPLTISALFREHWGGIFSAHPWLSGPAETYLGYSARGGGAGGEHSHAINIWQHFAHLLGMGRIKEVSAMLDEVADETVRYDRICQLSVRTETGLVGNVVQDVVTSPPQKQLRIQTENGFLEWIVNSDARHDALRYTDGAGGIREEHFEKSRPDDFKGEIDHLERLLRGETPPEPISLERGMETMLVLAAAHKSQALGKTVTIDYGAGCRPEAII